jgi:hypothetical protein
MQILCTTIHPVHHGVEFEYVGAGVVYILLCVIWFDTMYALSLLVEKVYVGKLLIIICRFLLQDKKSI